jgi:iron complex outermembrane receptor protein
LNKQIILKRSVIAVALTLGGTSITFAQTGGGSDGSIGNGDQPQQLQRVYVTGSSIKRTDTETASPVQILRREEIKQTGASTVRGVLDTLTNFDSGTLRDNGGASGFARGASGASIHGMGKAATLVLVNGRRVSNYAFADGGKETFVNVDTIPADAIERIEILADGASSTYGSDAMAGVINIITRTTFEGVRLSADVTRPQGASYGGENTAAITVGKGNFDRDGYNVYATVEGYRRFGYMLADVMPYYAPWHRKYVSPAFGDPSVYSFPGNLNEAKSSTHPAIRQPVASCPPSQLNAGGLCTSNINGINQYSDPAQRVNMFSQGRFKVSNNTTAFAEVAYSSTETTYQTLPYANAAGSATNWFDGNTKKSQSVPKPKLQVGNPANPFPYPVGIDYRFMDNMDMWQSPSKATQYRVMAGLEGTLANGWDWQAAAGRVGGDAKSRDHGPDRDAMPQAVESGEYKIGGPNSQELLNRMFPEIGTNAKLSQDWVDAKISGETGLQLPGGPLSFAVGGEYRHESMFIRSTDNVVEARIIGRGSLWIDGERNMGALYGELTAPITKTLEANAAVRVDKNQGFDSHVSPKVGLKYQVVPQVLLRGTFAGGFRAPNIPETLGKVGLTGFFNSTLDPKRCDTATKVRDILKTGNANDVSDATVAYNSGCLTSVPAMISSSRDLKPETSRTMTLGFVIEPVKNVNASVDYWKIERRDEISYRDPSYVLAREDNAGYKELIARNPVSEQDVRLADRANALKPGSNLAFPVGNIQSLLLNYENFGKTESSGVDIDINSRSSLGSYGSLYLGLKTMVALTWKQWDIDAGEYRPNTVGNRGTPKLVSVLSATWRKGDWASTIRVNRTSAMALNYDETDEATWNVAGCKARIKPTDDLPCFQRASLRTDLNFSYSGFKNLRLALNIRNALNDAAPIDLRGGYVLRPRQIKATAEYTF